MLKIGNRDGKVPAQKDDRTAREIPPAPESASPAKSTVIGENISIDGVIKAEEDIVIEGTFAGGIIAKSRMVTVGKSGRVEADVQAENVVVCGRMKGAIVAFNRVQIDRSADFTGQIRAKSITVEDGAVLKATIELDKDIREKTHAGPQHRVDAILFPAEGHGDKKTLCELPQPASKN